MQTKTIGYCNHCGFPVGTFNDGGELMVKIAEQKSCQRCGASFSFREDDIIDNLNWRKITLPTPTDTDFWDLIHPTIREMYKTV